MAPTKKSEELELKRKRCESFLQQISSINAYLMPEVVKALDEAALDVRLDQVDRLEKRFDGTFLHVEDGDSFEEIRTSFLEQYIEAKTKLTRHAYSSRSHELHRSTARLGEEGPSFVYATPKQRLPVLQIPKFSGNYTDWPDFYSMFKTVIDKEVELTKVEKFQHLRSSLRDAALDTIRSLEITEQNYDKALDLLKNRFDNKRLNFQAHIQDIFQLRTVDGESVVKLRELSDKMNAHLRALQTMGTKEQVADCVLIHLVCQKLDVASRAKWEEDTPISEIPTWNSMSTFLERRCQRLENVEHALVTKTPSKQVGKKPFSNINRKAFVASSTNGCLACNSNEHALFQCDKFLSLSPPDRYKEAKKLKLCLNCLKSGHSLKNCKSRGCRNCSRKHNTLLHLDSSYPFRSTASGCLSESPSSSCQISNPFKTQALTSQISSAAASLVSSEPEAVRADKDFVLLATAIILHPSSTSLQLA